MEIRCPVHGSIHIHPAEIPVIEHPFFQRLRGIKQLGFAEYVFPGATHTRFLHSIGVMSIADKAFKRLFADSLHKKDTQKLHRTFKLACLLHDIGHAPLSHSTEFAMPNLTELKMPKNFIFGDQNKQATHEDYTIKSIVDSSFSEAFKIAEDEFGVNREQVAELIVGRTSQPDYFTIDNVNYFFLLHQLVSSELDCDRMDYLLRDSYFCGVSYGRFDLDWMLDNLEICVEDDKAYLGISERAVSTFDDFLLSRFHMFLMVYFHYRAVCLEQLLLKYFKSCPDEYQIPGDIEQYQFHDDYFLMQILRNSKSPYAKGIINNKIPQKVFESFNKPQFQQVQLIKEYFDKKGVDYIYCSSLSRLSKYYDENKENSSSIPLKVSRHYFGTKSRTYKNITQATDLFEKFSASHTVTRLHADVSKLSSQDMIEIQKIIVG